MVDSPFPGRHRHSWQLGRLRCCLITLALLCNGVQADAVRAVSLAPHLTELVFAVGAEDQLVGVVAHSDYPPQALELPVIGDAFRFDLERIMSLEPNLALAWRGGTPERAVTRLEQIGIEIFWIETRTLEQIASALAQIGHRLGKPESGAQAAADFRRQLAALDPATDRDGTIRTVFYQVSARPLYTLGGRHVINEVFEHCGLENIFSGLDVEAAVVGLEAVLAAAPDLIIAARDSTDDDPLAVWRNSNLVRRDTTTLHQVEASLLVRPTSRIIEGIRHVCALVYPVTHSVTYSESESIQLQGLARREWQRPFQETEHAQRHSSFACSSKLETAKPAYLRCR